VPNSVTWIIGAHHISLKYSKQPLRTKVTIDVKSVCKWEPLMDTKTYIRAARSLPAAGQNFAGPWNLGLGLSPSSSSTVILAMLTSL